MFLRDKYAQFLKEDHHYPDDNRQGIHIKLGRLGIPGPGGQLAKDAKFAAINEILTTPVNDHLRVLTKAEAAALEMVIEQYPDAVLDLFHQKKAELAARQAETQAEALPFE